MTLEHTGPDRLEQRRLAGLVTSRENINAGPQALDTGGHAETSDTIDRNTGQPHGFAADITNKRTSASAARRRTTGASVAFSAFAFSVSAASRSTPPKSIDSRSAL